MERQGSDTEKSEAALMLETKGEAKKNGAQPIIKKTEKISKRKAYA